MLYLNQERCTSSMLGSPAGPGAPSQRGIWTSTSIPSAAGFTADGFSKYGVYSLFPGGPAFGSALYSHANAFSRFTSGQFQPTPGSIFHGSHKVSDSMFSSAGYTFGAPTPPPGSPYSPIPVAQLEFLTKGINSNIIIQHQASDFSHPSPKKIQITEKRCDEKCCNNIKQKSCLCLDESPPSSVNIKGKFADNNSGCSRTNPIEWGSVNVKKEPGHPCQVAEISTSISPVIKVEVTSPKNGEKDINPANGNIPVGVAVARQRIQQPELINSPSLPPAGLLTTVNAAGQVKDIARLSEFDPTQQAGMAASLTAGGAAGGTILQCPEDRNATMASWSIGGTQSSSLSTPTLWQYPAPVPMDSMVPLPVPMPPVGFQLVRDHTSGGFLLLPTTTNLEPIQQAVVWPSYPQPSPLLLPPLPPPPLQLLGSAASDYLSSSSATFHQQTQTHSTRLVALTTDTKSKLPLPPTTLIKIEADTSTLDQSKTISTVSSAPGAVFSDPNLAPLVTTHLIYQHPPNLILSQPTTLNTSVKPQIMSPLPCLTPPPEISNNNNNASVCNNNNLEEPPLAVDASNQTDSLMCNEEDNNISEIAAIPPSATPELPKESEVKITEIIEPPTIMRDTPSVPMELETEPTQKVENTKTEDEDENENEIENENQPDISGLQLLSDSIVEFESCHKAEVPQLPAIEKSKEPVEDTLGGLDLLCALAEQRILEESSETTRTHIKSKKEKRRSRRHSDEPRHKKRKSDKHSDKLDLSRGGPVLKRSASEGNYGDIQSDNVVKCMCREKKYKSYRTPQSEEDARKFLASRNQSSCCQSEWPCMNAMELDMRIKLAELQRQYKEKQKELNKLNSKKRHHHHHHHHHDGCKRRKKSHSERSDRTPTPPPLPEEAELKSPSKVTVTNDNEVLKPPTFYGAVEKTKPSKLCCLKKKRDSVEIRETVKLESDATRKSVEVRRSSHEKDRKTSKKRKIERPKRIFEQFTPTTETIVAKKPKTNSFVGYLIAAKEKLQMSQSFSDSPPRFIDDSTVYTGRKNQNNNNIIVEKDANLDVEDDDEEWESEAENDFNNSNKSEEVHSKTESTNIDKEKPKSHVCTLTPAHLEMENLRVLTAMGGLFYAGRLHAVEPPDVYSITLDGERGNRPHIMSREEILRDAIVEIAPKSTDELEPGTRLCAYWSQQYRCLYPGTVAEPENPEMDSKFVAVEFDDGDNGTIVLEDIRLLPSNYPVMEYDPNPLLSLCKRKRRASSSATAEIRQTPQSTTVVEETIPQPVAEESNDIIRESNHRERKKLKKQKKKMKMKLDKTLEKRKKKKHRCVDEICKHKKHHKKHRKHKKRHDKNESSTTLDTLDEKTESDESGTVAEEVSEANLSKEETETETEIVEETRIAVDEPADVEEFVPNPEDEVTMDDILEVVPNVKKMRDRQASCESSRSKMSAFLPARQLWSWSGKGYKRPRGKGRGRKEFFKSIQRGKEQISVGDAAVFLSTGRPDRPYIGRIEAMWEQCGTMAVRVKWFYHPEETVGCPENLRYPGALFESPHADENDVQTISHKCEVLPLDQYIDTLGNDPKRFAAIYENNDIYYLAGYYDPTSTSLRMEEGIPSDEK